MKLNYKRTLLVGLAFLSICAFWQLYDNVVPLILKNTFDIPDDIAGVIMALDNVLALFLLPLFGKLSDRTHTRLGRRMPYILGGTLVAVVLMNLLPVADAARSLWLFVVALGLLLLAMGVYRSPRGAHAGRNSQAPAQQGQRHHQPDGHTGRGVYAGCHRPAGHAGRHGT